MEEGITIGITGPISEVNFGDYAMFINNVYDLKVKNIVIFSYNKGFSDKILSEYCQNFNINICEVNLKDTENQLSEKNNDNSRKVGYLPFRYPTITPLDCLLNAENYDEISDYIKEIDILIVNGGGYFNHLWNNSLWRSSMLQKIIIPIIIANQQNKKIFFTGNSFGPFDDSEEFFLYLFNYLKNTTFAVRDTLYSKKYLQRIGINEKSIMELPDDLYIINEKILEKDIKIDINIDNYIVMELYYSLDIIKSKIDLLKDFSMKIYKKYGLKIVFLPFDLSRGGEEQGNYLKEKLDNFFYYDISKTGFLPIQDAVNIIKKAKLVLATRYHAAVLALANKTPLISIVKPVCNDHRYYFNKTCGLLRNTFNGLKLNEMLFMRNSLEDALEYIENDFEYIIAEQKELYNNKIYDNSKILLKESREKYFYKISRISGEK